METLGWYRYEGTVESQGGIGIEMERLAAQMGDTIKWPYNESECLDADYFKIVADHLIREQRFDRSCIVSPLKQSLGMGSLKELSQKVNPEDKQSERSEL